MLFIPSAVCQMVYSVGLAMFLHPQPVEQCEAHCVTCVLRCRPDKFEGLAQEVVLFDAHETSNGGARFF
jgi:hypothetical protein